MTQLKSSCSACMPLFPSVSQSPEALPCRDATMLTVYQRGPAALSDELLVVRLFIKSILEVLCAKQLNTRHCSYLGPQQYTCKVRQR